jgi:hypothetical protein
MQDIIQIAGYVNESADIVMIEGELSEGKEVLDVSDIAGKEVVHTDNRVAFLNEAVAKVRT